ncbi:MAG: hypothetical protein KDA96_24310, partial [Planctomycetaceae bacterium]|nr:hypothetical protein [Planctomycetaceae bacterium]
MTDKALYSENGKTWHDGKPIKWSHDPSVRKIVIGTPPIRGNDPKPISLTPPLPQDFKDLYPNLTHLYLWQIKDLAELPELPGGLKCLDVRACPVLTTIIDIPKDVDTLVLQDLEALTTDADFLPAGFTQLSDLSLNGSPGVSDGWIRRVLGTATSLRRIDLSACPQLQRITDWPEGLDYIRLNECTSLRLLPNWPPSLRRIDLRGCNQIRRVPDFPDTIDYIDLARTRSLEALPKQRGNPRTLILYGSGTLEPPASEHGSHDEENVAGDVDDYFDDVRLTGPGTVRRCKLLILGNGDAGKTCLAMNLVGQDYRAFKEQAHAEGRAVSTHGVQFWDVSKFKANVKGVQSDVHLHLWDFGGQEIYHNTHRLFISQGTVFVVVWNPDESAVVQRQRDTGYLDTPRKLQYWIDLIRRSCDHIPEIAIVCSRRSSSTPELNAILANEIRPELREKTKCYFVDSWEKSGEVTKLMDWLADEVGHVIATQGTAVPKYWEIAQEMVEHWVDAMRHDANFARKFNSLSVNQFKKELKLHIDKAVKSNPESCALFAAAIKARKFKLTENRIRRTLSFLTRSGWLYWAADLFEGRVIIGQQWALDGLYTV